MGAEMIFSIPNYRGFSLNPAILISEWSFSRHPPVRKVLLRSEALRSSLESIPSIGLKPELVSKKASEETDEPENREELQVILENIRALLVLLQGRSMERVLRQVRYLLGSKSIDLQHAAENAVSRLIEAEQSIVFVLDMDVEDEWLPEPAPQGTLPTDEDSIPIPEL